MRQSLFRRAARSTGGVTLLEVVVTIAILGVIASVMVVAVDASSRLGGEGRRIDDAAAVLAQLRDASVRFNLGTSFRDTSFTAEISTATTGYGGWNPGRLSQLTEPIVVSSTSYVNSCGTAYPTLQATAWVRNFYPYPISSTTPIRIADGFYADDKLVRYDSSGNPTVLPSGDANVRTAPGTLAIVMRNVAIADADALNARMEGDQNGGSSSILRYTRNGSAPVTVSYHMTIHGC